MVHEASQAAEAPLKAQHRAEQMWHETKEALQAAQAVVSAGRQAADDELAAPHDEQRGGGEVGVTGVVVTGAGSAAVASPSKAFARRLVAQEAHDCCLLARQACLVRKQEALQAKQSAIAAAMVAVEAAEGEKDEAVGLLF